jgi:hypothetical protein
MLKSAYKGLQSVWMNCPLLKQNALFPRQGKLANTTAKICEN